MSEDKKNDGYRYVNGLSKESCDITDSTTLTEMLEAIRKRAKCEDYFGRLTADGHYKDYIEKRGGKRTAAPATFSRSNMTSVLNHAPVGVALEFVELINNLFESLIQVQLLFIFCVLNTATSLSVFDQVKDGPFTRGRIKSHVPMCCSSKRGLFGKSNGFYCAVETTGVCLRDVCAFLVRCTHVVGFSVPPEYIDYS